MRSVLPFASVLLLAVPALAQPIISPEVISTPLAYRNYALQIAAPAVALARDERGAAIAWAMQNAAGDDRVYVSRLDATGHVAGGVREVAPVFTDPQLDAIFPSLAASPSGRGFTLAWMEVPKRVPTAARASYCRLDADLSPSPSQYLPSLPYSALRAPVLRATKTSTWMAMDGDVWELHEDGSVTGPTATGVHASDMAVGPTGFPSVAGIHTPLSTTIFSCAAGCAVGGGPFNGFCPEQCRTYSPDPSKTSIDFVMLYSLSSALRLSFSNDSQPALCSDSRGVIVAWLDGPLATGGDVRVTRNGLDSPVSVGHFGRGPGGTRPAIATDGQRYVIVWSSMQGSGRDIYGASIDADGKVTNFEITTSPADERDPSIVYLGGGMFLVAYESFAGTERHIAGRFLEFPSRQRAVR